MTIPAIPRLAAATPLLRLHRREVTRLAAQLVVIAKAPVPGRVKTRLTPPFTPRQAAQLAEAALADTLAAVAQVPVARRVLALDGAPGSWLPAGFDVVSQCGGGLDNRIAAALGDAHARLPVPVILIGMDTPQVTPGLLESAIRPLAEGTADAVFGPAADGGFWLLGLRQPDPRLVAGVPMSVAVTGAVQLARLAAAGLRVHQTRCCTDVDNVADAVAVAREIPHGRFAAALRTMAPDPALPGAGRQLTAAGRDAAVSAPTGRVAAARAAASGRALRHCYLLAHALPADVRGG